LSAHLSKELRKQYKRRAVPLRNGDEIRVVCGEFKGKSGKVARVDLQKLKIFVEGLKQKKVSGQEADVAIDPSNVVVVRMNVDDKERAKSLQRTIAAASAEKQGGEAKTTPAKSGAAASAKSDRVAKVPKGSEMR